MAALDQLQLGDLEISTTSALHMVSAFLAMEQPDVVISFAREFGGGTITEFVQSHTWERCISKADVRLQGSYLKRFLKKLILEIESSGGVVLDELYEQYMSYLAYVQDDDAAKGISRVRKTISFIFPSESCALQSCPEARKLDVQLQCSINMLEGDTGCSIWPSSLFLSEFILSFPEIFSSKCCFEVGSGVGLAGICLAHVKASKLILTDGDLSALANMKVNLILNHISTETQEPGSHVDKNLVRCVYLPWESASEDDLRGFAPDIVLGADVIYNPSCLPHLVRVLGVLLKHEHSHDDITASHGLDILKGEKTSSGSSGTEPFGHHPIKGPVAFLASVIRNVDTFNYFLALAEQANLNITDLTQRIQVHNFLPYLRSYPKSSIRIFRINA